MNSESSRSVAAEGTGRGSTRRRVLRTGAGVVAGVGAVSSLSTSVTAHFPEALVIDVKPGCADNPLNPEGGEVVPVAVLSTEFVDDHGESVSFDPTDHAVHYRFGAPEAVENGGGAYPIDGGVCTDAGTRVLRFPLDDAGFSGGETTAMLRWQREANGEHGYSGIDDVVV